MCKVDERWRPFKCRSRRLFEFVAVFALAWRLAIVRSHLTSDRQSEIRCAVRPRTKSHNSSTISAEQHLLYFILHRDRSTPFGRHVSSPPLFRRKLPQTDMWEPCGTMSYRNFGPRVCWVWYVTLGNRVPLCYTFEKDT